MEEASSISDQTSIVLGSPLGLMVVVMVVVVGRVAGAGAGVGGVGGVLKEEGAV